MRACWLKWVGRDRSISADYIWLNYSGANTPLAFTRFMTPWMELARKLSEWDPMRGSRNIQS